MSEYKVKFKVFEGPLDLLLYLVRKEEVDIYEVNLTNLATQFIEYVDLMRQLDLDIAGEFLVMAATLMYIKSKELLPVDKQVLTDDDEDEGEDPRHELIRQLVEYKKFKDAASNLQHMEVLQEQVYPRMPGKLEFKPDPEQLKTEVSVFALINAVNSIIKRVNERDDLRDIFEDQWTVSEKLQDISQRVMQHEKISFSSLFSDVSTRHEVVVTFLALLELIRLKQIVVHQEEAFGDIDLRRGIPEEADDDSDDSESPEAVSGDADANEGETPAPLV